MLYDICIIYLSQRNCIGLLYAAGFVKRELNMRSTCWLLNQLLEESTEANCHSF